VKYAIAFAALVGFTACTTTEMVTVAASECDSIGYAKGTPEHTACTERGFRQKDALQDQIVKDAAWWAVLELAY
jgi:formiminotetrahydrofolate cyclodeaminase